VESVSVAADSNPPGELYCTTCEKNFHVGERCPTDGTRLLKLKARIDPFLGRDLDGRYTVLEKLGQGGMGAVYRGEQHSVNREVAIKVVNTSLVSDPEVIKRFLREAKLASRLAHPNAVGVLDFGQTEDGVFFLVMELVSGRTLDQAIKAEKIFRPERVVRIGTQICDALDGAHALSIIHRDLKPSNVMLLNQGRDLVKVLDFGLAKSVSPDATSTTMTGAGAIVGTPAFMPPELATGMPCDGRADLYSLGCILYYLGSGRLPFYSESVHELLAMHGSDEVAPPMPGVPHRLARVVAKLLEKDPRQRYQTAAEALQALEMSLATATPAHGVPYAEDTHPSIGPFPADSAAFAHLETPLPPSIVTDRFKADAQRARSATEVQRIVTGETMLAGVGAPVAAVSSQPGTSSLADFAPEPVKKKAKWPLFAALAGTIAVGGITFAVLSSGGAKEPNKPVEPPAVIQSKPAVVEDTKPAVVEDTKPAVVEDTKPAVVEPPPVTDPALTVAKPIKPTKPTKPRPVKPVKPVKPEPTGTTTTPTTPPTPTTTKPPPTKLPF
jgi:serine/threonine protein kinase